MLRSFVDKPSEAKKYLQYGNHTQPVERGIKDLSFVAKRHPPEDRDAVIKLIHANRQKMRSFRTRCEYNVFEAGLAESLEPDEHEMEEEEANDEDPYISDDGLATDSESDCDMN